MELTGQMEPIERLTSVVTPPSGLWNYVIDWQAAESALGVGLPDDYKLIVELYQWGGFDDDLGIWVPPEMAPHPGADIVKRGPEIGGEVERDWTYLEYNPWMLPGATTVNASDLGLARPVKALGWGGDSSGATGYWLITGADPNRWPVLYAWWRGATYQLHPAGLAAFLTTKCSGEYGDDWNASSFTSWT
ncbi:hypothetical protein AOT85_06825 [Mycobacteroides sp. H054]|nr:hypothetical protein AOT86_09720 [Mycobacteroides sp. H072]KRQ53754.1 hypothetical protein AOT85_06825 [Mycobacteroides sp. H054]